MAAYSVYCSQVTPHMPPIHLASVNQRHLPSVRFSVPERRKSMFKFFVPRMRSGVGHDGHKVSVLSPYQPAHAKEFGMCFHHISTFPLSLLQAFRTQAMDRKEPGGKQPTNPRRAAMRWLLFRPREPQDAAAMIARRRHDVVS
ncbi:hypothetical protein EDB85DRAFT_1894408 [Lactarius pseudohatsudake]|nr:hypothetical protein EDB85DRAFT_1894408 [Lactarius pseudohatsudake]